MPYVRGSFRRGRKFYRRSRKGRARRRFARKKFYKRVPRGLKAGLYIPKEAYVKLNYTEFIYSPEITVGNNWTFGFNGNGICAPSTTGGFVPVSGQEYPLGLTQYSSFYKYYKVLGSSIKIQLNNLVSGSGSTATGPATVCLLAGQGLNGDSDSSSNWQVFENAETRNLISYPGASWKMMSQINGSQTTVWLKGFRKTKTMLGRKDIRDNDDVQGLLPGTDDSNPNGTNPGINGGLVAGYSGSWFWMVRVDPTITNGTTPANSYQVVVKIKYYVQLYGRDFNEQGIVPEE